MAKLAIWAVVESKPGQIGVGRRRIPEVGAAACRERRGYTHLVCGENCSFEVRDLSTHLLTRVAAKRT